MSYHNKTENAGHKEKIKMVWLKTTLERMDALLSF